MKDFSQWTRNQSVYLEKEPWHMAQNENHQRQTSVFHNCSNFKGKLAWFTVGQSSEVNLPDTQTEKVLKQSGLANNSRTKNSEAYVPGSLNGQISTANCLLHKTTHFRSKQPSSQSHKLQKQTVWFTKGKLRINCLVHQRTYFSSKLAVTNGQLQK